MGILPGPRRSSQNMVLKVQSELAFWRKRYPANAFCRVGVGSSFESCVSTLKSGYDLYLLNRRRPLNQLPPTLPSRHVRDLPQHERTGWPLAKMVIRETCNRMRSSPAAGDAAQASNAAAFAGAG